MTKQSRKPTVWTKEKISQLIALYRKHECLWNHFTNAYKRKEQRAKAVEEICAELRITKFDFGKKIHNLRNQFNSEMKKLEKRIEVAGCDESSAGQRCRWEHFESLMFLKNIIEPRPGGYQTGFPQPKKMRFKCEYSNAESPENFMPAAENPTAENGSTRTGETYHFEETTVEEAGEDPATCDDFESYEEVIPVQEKESFDQKYSSVPGTTLTSQDITITTLTSQPQAPTNKTYITKVHHYQQRPPQTNTQKLQMEESQHSANDSTTTDAHQVNTGSLKTTTSSRKTMCDETPNNGNNRDQWDAFGELIANEFRNLISDVSRKKLKRKFMQAMLEVGEEDDELNVRQKQ